MYTLIDITASEAVFCGQHRLYCTIFSGNVINVAANFEKSVKQLPRGLDDAGLMHVSFKRRLKYKQVQ